MSQPVGFQKGWESEKGGNWMLSKLAFVANPGNNGDDIGWDAFCTLKMRSGDGFEPGRAFTVQIKEQPRRHRPLKLSRPVSSISHTAVLHRGV